MNLTQHPKESGRASVPLPLLGPILLLLIGALFIAGILVFFGRIGWPGLHWDAALYGPPVLNVANGRGWIIGSYAPQIIQRSDLVFNFHGLLHVILYGAILKARSWSDYMLFQGLVNALTFAVYASVYTILFAKIWSFGYKAAATGVLTACVPSLIVLGLQGRPEQLAPLILTIPIITQIISTDYRRMRLSLGVCLGLLAILSPLLAIIFGTFLIGYFYLESKGRARKAFFNLIVCTFLGSATAAIIVIIFTPFNPISWFVNVSTVSSKTSNFEGILLAPTKFFWGLSGLFPAWNIIILIYAFTGLRAVSHAQGNRALIFFIYMPAIIYVNQKSADYSLVPFIPFAIAWHLTYFSGLIKMQMISYRAINISYVLISAFSGLYFASLIAHFLLVTGSGNGVTSLGRLRDSFIEEREVKSRNILIAFPQVISPSLVILSDGGTKIFSISNESPLGDDSNDMLSSYEAKIGGRVKYYVVPQTYMDRFSSPPEKLQLGGHAFTLKRHNWIHHPQNRFNRLLNRLAPTGRYNYAVYQRRS